MMIATTSIIKTQPYGEVLALVVFHYQIEF